LNNGQIFNSQTKTLKTHNRQLTTNNLKQVQDPGSLTNSVAELVRLPSTLPLSS